MLHYCTCTIEICNKRFTTEQPLLQLLRKFSSTTHSWNLIRLLTTTCQYASNSDCGHQFNHNGQTTDVLQFWAFHDFHVILLHCNNHLLSLHILFIVRWKFFVSILFLCARMKSLRWGLRHNSESLDYNKGIWRGAGKREFPFHVQPKCTLRLLPSMHDIKLTMKHWCLMILGHKAKTRMNERQIRQKPREDCYSSSENLLKQSYQSRTNRRHFLEELNNNVKVWKKNFCRVTPETYKNIQSKTTKLIASSKTKAAREAHHKTNSKNNMPRIFQTLWWLQNSKTLVHILHTTSNSLTISNIFVAVECKAKYSSNKYKHD